MRCSESSARASLTCCWMRYAWLASAIALALAIPNRQLCETSAPRRSATVTHRDRGRQSSSAPTSWLDHLRRLTGLSRAPAQAREADPGAGSAEQRDPGLAPPACAAQLPGGHGVHADLAHAALQQVRHIPAHPRRDL